MKNNILSKKHKEFLQIISVKKYILSYIIAAATISISFFVLVKPENYILLVSIVYTVLGFLGIITAKYLRNEKILIESLIDKTNLFASSAKLVSDLFIIVKKDGTVIYSDTEFSLFFENKNKPKLMHIEQLKDFDSFTNETFVKIQKALDKSETVALPISINSQTKNKKIVYLKVSPILIDAYHNKTKTMVLTSSDTKVPSGCFLINIKKTTAKRKYIKYVDHHGLGWYRLDDKGNISFANEKFAKDIGYDLNEIIKNPLPLASLINNKNEQFNVLNNFSESIEIINKNKDKKNYFINQVLVDDKINKKYFEAVVIDIPNGYQEVNTTKTIFSDNETIKSLPLPCAIVDFSGKINIANSSFEELFKSNDDDNIINLIARGDREVVKTNIDFANSINYKSNKSINISFENNNEKKASLYLSPLVKNKKVTGVICHVVDTTEFKNLEMHFAHSQKMQAVGQLAGGIAHDFNNLLTAMIGFCDLLLGRHPAGDKSFADIMQIKQNANRAANLVSQLLAFSRKQTLQPKIINITDVFADLSNLIGRLIGEDIGLRFIHGKDLWNVKVDQGQLEQVIMNLAVNARDSMEGGGILSITTKNFQVKNADIDISDNMLSPVENEKIDLGDYVLIEVKDNGCGMGKDLINKIFEPFFSTKKIGSGTGLGLATVYGIIKQTNGYIYVDSKVGNGTKFSIFLRRFNDITEKKTYNTKISTPVLARDLTGTGTILVVEDESPVRLFAVSALTNKGYKILEADCAEQALKIIESEGEKIDVIITDVVMPGMKGTTMIEKISAIYPNIKVIFMSGYAEDAFFSSFGSEHKFNFLQKPFSLKQLVTKVKTINEES